jgi:hypothetical protein
VSVIHSDAKPKLTGLISYHVDRPGGEVLPFDDAMEVNEGAPLFHRAPKTNVFVVLRVRPTVAIQKQGAVGCEAVVVGRRPVRIWGCCCDRKGELGENRGLEDALNPF